MILLRSIEAAKYLSDGLGSLPLWGYYSTAQYEVFMQTMWDLCLQVLGSAIGDAMGIPEAAG
jgi:hypothetical protein